MLVFKHSFTCSNVGSPDTKLCLFNPCNILTKNRESCVVRNISKMIICHTLNDATVCCGQIVCSKYAAGAVSSIFCDHNLKPPILTNILHASYASMRSVVRGFQQLCKQMWCCVGHHQPLQSQLAVEGLQYLEDLYG